jgi:hypothetical protein
MGKLIGIISLIACAALFLFSINLWNTPTWESDFAEKRIAAIYFAGFSATLIIFAPLYWILGSIHETLLDIKEAPQKRTPPEPLKPSSSHE